jgi:hypothetical protein
LVKAGIVVAAAAGDALVEAAFRRRQAQQDCRALRDPEPTAVRRAPAAVTVEAAARRVAGSARPVVPAVGDFMTVSDHLKWDAA